MITTNKQLQTVVSQLKKQQQIAIDTEFYWRNTYYPQLCLIQIATTDSIYLIDALADALELQLLQQIFEDNNITKVMHAADNDIKILKHYLNCQFNAIFDTQIACAFLGHANQISLQKLLAFLDLHKLDKQQKLSDWRVRPLSDEQIHYAHADVEFLIDAAAILQSQLAQKNYTHCFEEEMLEQQKSAFPCPNEAPLHMSRQINKLKIPAQENLYKLTIWRESYAQSHNYISRRTLTDKELIKIAYHMPKTLEDFSSQRLLSTKKIHKYAQLILHCLWQTPSTFSPKAKTMQPLNRELLQTIYEYLIQQTKDLQISNELVCSKNDLKYFIRHFLSNSRKPKGKLTTGWRYEYFGKPIIKAFLDQQASLSNTVE